LTKEIEMSKSIVITLIGEDRPGIVESISSIITQYKGEWVDSRMANLSGRFTGILRINFPYKEVDRAVSHLKLNPIDGINLQVEEVNDAYENVRGKCFKFELIGQDRPGIVHRVSSVIVNNGATVDAFESEVIEASMSGEKLFKSNITICLEEDRNIDELCTLLEELENELMVDITSTPLSL